MDAVDVLFPEDGFFHSTIISHLICLGHNYIYFKNLKQNATAAIIIN